MSVYGRACAYLFVGARVHVCVWARVCVSLFRHTCTKELGEKREESAKSEWALSENER